MLNRFKTMDWLADLIFPLVIILMETFWVYPWLFWLGNFPFYDQPRPALSLGSVFIVLAAATLAIRVFQRRKWPVGVVRAAIIASGLVIILLILAAEYGDGYEYLSSGWFGYFGQSFANAFSRPDTIIIALPALLYLWWRGINLGQMTFNFKNIYRSFLIGIAAIVVLIILWQISSSSGQFPEPGTSIGFDVLAVFFFGLMAIAISHLYAMRSTMPKEEAGLTSVWRWMPTMLTVIGGMIILVFAIAGIFSPGFFTGIGHFLSVIWSFVSRVIDYVIIPLNYVFEAIIWILRWLIARIPKGEPLSQNMTDNMTIGDVFGRTEQVELSPALILALKWMMIAAVIFVVIFILAKAVSRFRARRAEEEIEEIHESLFSWRDVGNDLKGLFGQLGKKFQRKRTAGGYFSDDETALDVREMYRRMLYEASRSGYNRSRHETPDEYTRRMKGIVPEGQEPLKQITEIYVGVRYGETKPPGEKVEKANSLWQILRKLFRGIRGE
jgi:hypothetical protein